MKLVWNESSMCMDLQVCRETNGEQDFRLIVFGRVKNAPMNVWLLFCRANWVTKYRLVDLWVEFRLT